MRIRVVASGIVAGAFCLIALWFPWYVVHPAEITSDWGYQPDAAKMPDWLPAVVGVFCGSTLFASGWVAARWNWSKNRRDSMLSGAGAGLVASCLIYDFLAAFHFGLLGQEEILTAFYSEMDMLRGLTLVSDGIAQSASYLYLNFIAILLGGLFVGALGGLASSIDLEDVWGKPPREPDGWLFRLPAYSLTITGSLSLIVVIAALSILQKTVIDMVVENNLSGIRLPPVFITLSAYLAAAVVIFLPMSLTWGWIARSWKGAGLWRMLYGIWLALTILFAGWVIRAFLALGEAAYLFNAGPYPLPLLWALTVLIIAAGFVGGYLSTARTAGESKYQAADWFGYVLTQGILGGTQIFASFFAYGLVLTLVTVENIPHLIQAGIVPYSPAQQITRLFKMMSGFAQGLIVISAIGGWMFGLTILLFRKFLKIKTVLPPPEPESAQAAS